MKNIYLLFLSLVIFSCQNQQKIDIQKAKQASIDSMKVGIEKQRIIDSMTIATAPTVEEKKVVYVNRNSGVATGATSGTSTTTTTKKKGWSRAAKGAVIGAGVGAITGAVVSKKKGQGAIIGGLAGAGLGAGTGAILDSKKGDR